MVIVLQMLTVGGGGTTNSTKKDQNEVEDAHCLVKFCPCKDWRGEYGFDWVREGEKDFYKERIGTSVYTYEYGDSALDYVKAELGEKYEEWEREVLAPLVRGRKREKEDYVRNGTLCMQGEERERYLEDFARWEAETDETKKDAMLEDLANRKLKADYWYIEYNKMPDCMNDEVNAEIDAIILDVYARCEKDRIEEEKRKTADAEPQSYAHKWKNDKTMRVDESKAAMDEGKPPFEYFYDVSHVNKVIYRIKHNWPIWTYEVHTKDQANQSEEAQKADSLLKTEAFRHLDHFIQLQGGKCSMLKDDDSGSSFTVPFYRLKEEGITLTDELKNKKYALWKKKSKDSCSFQQWISVSEVVARGNLMRDVCWFSEKEDSPSVHYLDYFDELRTLTNYNNVEFEKEKRTFELRYCKVGDVKYVLASIFEAESAFRKTKKYELFYENNVLKDVDSKAYSKLDTNAKKAVDEYCKGIEDDIKTYSEMNVDSLLEQVKAGTIDNVVLTVYRPTDVGKYSISESNGLKTENGHSELDYRSITSWKEAYEDTFTPFHVRNFFEGEKKGELKKCLVPVLSISDAENKWKDKKRKRFVFNSLTDAPKKEDEETHKYKLQMGFQGEAKAIEFKVVDGVTNEPSTAITVTPENIQNPNENEPYELTVEYKGYPDLGPWPKDWIVLAKNKDGEELKETVGKMRVRVNPHLSLTMLFIKVIVLQKAKKGKWNPKPFSKKLLDCLEDQEDALRNTLAQIGVELIVLHREITVKESEIKGLYDENSGLWDFCHQSDKVDKIFFDAFFEKYKSFSPYFKWCYYTFIFDTDDKGFKDASAFSFTIKHDKYPNVKFPRTIASGNVGENRLEAYVFSHELLHRLGNPHTFQFNNNEFSFPFCFQLESSSNIMDYWTLRYSLHQYQWSNMLTAIRSKTEESLRLERNDRIKARKKEKKAKKVTGNNQK